MKIAKVEVFISRPGRNYVTTKITTTSGITGVGDATLNGRELSVASYLKDHLAPLLVGRNAGQIEDTWQYLYRGGYWRRGPVTMAAIASIDMALWDIKGKAAGMPVYELLGGASRSECLTYGHAQGTDKEELFDNVRELQALGYRAIRLQVGIPGLGPIYGTGIGALPGEKKRWEAPLVEQWDTQKYLRFIPGIFEEARNEFGADLALLHDSHHRLTPIEAARLAKDLEPSRLFWLEDVTPSENQAAMRLVREASTTPLAIGEVFNSVWDTQHLIQEQLIDYVRMSVTHGGGISPLKKILDFASMYQIKSGAHGPEDVSPIGMAAALQLGTSIHNFGIQEFARYSQASTEVFEPAYTFENGALKVSETPGLGVTFREDLAQKYDYEGSYLPVNQLMDGTVHDW